MNDIEILEELRHELGLYANGEKVRQGQAIENLIQRNKDLEQIEQEHKEENGRLREENINLKEKIVRQQEQLNIANKKILAQKGQLKVVNNSYIPKSKVKEKIEEYNKMIDATFEEKTCFADNRRNTCMEIIQILQELLEESEKKYGYRRKYI